MSLQKQHHTEARRSRMRYLGFSNGVVILVHCKIIVVLARIRWWLYMFYRVPCFRWWYQWMFIIIQWYQWYQWYEWMMKKIMDTWYLMSLLSSSIPMDLDASRFGWSHATPPAHSECQRWILWTDPRKCCRKMGCSVLIFPGVSCVYT